MSSHSQIERRQRPRPRPRYGGVRQVVPRARPSLIDPGNPIGRTCTIEPDGAVTEGGANTASGYSIIETESIETAIELAKRGPIVQGGRTGEVSETVSPI